MVNAKIMRLAIDSFHPEPGAKIFVAHDLHL